MTVIGRHSLIERCLADVEEFRSVLVVGAEGMGKSAVLQALARRLECSHVAVFAVAGADGEAGVPLAPFADALARLGIPGHAPLDAYTRLARELEAASGMLVIDDVDRLDDASRVLFDHVARAGVPILASATDLEALPRSLVAGIDAGQWVRHTLGPLDADAVVQVAAQMLGEAPSVPAAAALIARADGSPRILGDLIATAGEGAVHREGGVDLGPRLVTVRDARDWEALRVALTATSMVTVEQLAVAGSLPLDAISDETLTVLRQQHLVTVGDSVSLPSLRVADAVLDSMSAALTLRRLGQAADLLAASDSVPREHTALVQARAGRTVPAEAAVDCAKTLLAQEDAAGALDVASAADAVDDRVLLVTGAALSALERHDEADATLSRVNPAAGGDVAYELCQEWGMLLAVRRGDPAGAVARVTAIRESLTDVYQRTVIDGELVKWRLMAGVPGAAPQDLTPEAGADLRVGMALIQAMVASMDGPPEAAFAIVAHGRQALAASTRPTRYAEELLALSEFLATGFDARLEDAESSAAVRRRAALRAGHSAVGLWEFASGELALHAGRYEQAESLARRAVAHLSWRDFTGLRAPAVALYAATAARLGHDDASAAAVDSLPSHAGDDVKVAVHLARAAAENRLRARDVTEAARLLREVGARAVTESHSQLGILAIDEAWMVSPTEQLSDEVCQFADAGALAALLARRVTAVRDEDVDALVAASDELGACGFVGRSVHGLGRAALMFEARGLPRDARRLTARARAIASFREASDWPLRGDQESLTPREREIATLAAARVRSREIADQLGVSARTVDNHLGSVFRKLGIQGRDELGEALPAADA